MGRTAVHTADSLLDAALALFATDGPRAVTMAAVARAAGAPSGSVYHRFPDRSALLAAMWRRTTQRFEHGYADTLGAEPDPDSAVRASVWVVEWCRAHPQEATLLHAGPRALHDGGAAPDAEHAAHLGELARTMAVWVARVAETCGRPADEVAFAMYDAPMAVVRRYLDAGREIPGDAADQVRRVAARLLA